MSLFRSLTLVAGIIIATQQAFAQGLRVETQVYDVTPTGQGTQKQLLSSSLSLFHSGRVYDYVESADEIIIYEPTARRFTILNPTRGMLTTIDFDEIRHLLESRKPKTQQYIRELSQLGTPDAKRTIQRLEFQSAPHFTVSHNRPQNVIALDSRAWKYRVGTRQWQDPDQVQGYLEYCDWTARLNHIVHPSGMSPEPRLKLNAELRRLDNIMPVSVQRDLRPDENLVLQAEHRFVNKLDDIDRSLIRRWDDFASGESLKKVSFRSYQQTTLVSQAR